MMEREAEEGQIVTFYSYKGGTGRTMALANIAVLMTQDTSRKKNKILLIDWDLEAPGMHRFFFSHFRYKQENDIYRAPGLIDFFKHVSDILKKDYSGQSVIAEDDVRKLFTTLTGEFLSEYVANTSFPGLQILKAGAFTKAYPSNISRFNWENFYNQVPSFFRIFSEMLKKEFDYILIDSRTGLNDTSGICTMLMPDKLCLIFTPNRQSLDGVKSIAQEAFKYRLTSSDMRPLMIYPIPSRVELAEKDLRDQWRKGIPEKKLKGFQPTFEDLFNEYYSTVKCNLTRYFDEVQIHHEPKYSYGEEIAVLNETFSDRLSLTKAYTSIEKKIVSDAPFWEEGDGIKIFFSYSRKDQKMVEEISKELTDKKFTIVSTDEIPVGEDQFRFIESKVLSADIFIPLVTKNFQTDHQFSSLEVYTFTEKKQRDKTNLVIPLFGSKELVAGNSFGLQRFHGILLDKFSNLKTKKNISIANEIAGTINKHEEQLLKESGEVLEEGNIIQPQNTIEEYQ